MPFQRIISLLALGATMTLARVAPAQQVETPTSPTKTWTIHKVVGAHIKVDGELDESAWSTLPPITDFTQTTPDLGAPISERTEVRIFYDDDNIYFGFKCYDDHPEKIIHRLGYHDAFTGSDSVDILLDTFHDRRTGFYFSINSRGIQFDGTINETVNSGSGFGIVDQTWDGIWYSAAVMQDWGWSAEVVIPFKSIRISHQPQQAWGFNVNRSITRKNEVASWVPVTRYDGVMKPSKAGTLAGLEDIHIGANLELIPYSSTTYHRVNWLPEQNGVFENGGLDVRYGLLQNLTLSATVNPDFADTEADEFTSQISRFEIFFPEKRKFFTEGANYFQTPLNLFFTRRVGAVLPDGQPQRIYEGAKLTGKQGPWTVGALEALTQRTEFLDPNTGVEEAAPGAFFGVLRLAHDVGEKSTVGFTSVNRIQQQDIFRDAQGNIISESESTQAVDLNILRGQHISWSSQMMMNLNALDPGIDAQHLGWYSTFNYDSELWHFGSFGKFLGNKVNLMSTGFEPEVDRWTGDIDTIYKPFINRYGIRQLFFELNYDEANGTHGELEDSGADTYVTVQFKNFWSLEAGHSYDRTRFWLFTPDFQRVCQTFLECSRLYIVPRYTVKLSTNNERPVVVTAVFTTGRMVQFDENFYGTNQIYELGVTTKPTDHLTYEMSGVLVHEHLLHGPFFQDRRFLINRINYQFTPKWRARILAQYGDNVHANNISINSLLAYDFTARSAFFIGYNRQRHVPLDLADLGNEVFVKISYLFGF